MVDIDKCSVWPLLCLLKLHRLYENYKTGHVLPADWKPFEFYTFGFTFTSRNVAEGSCVYGEPDSFPKATSVQRQGGDIKSSRWA